MSRSINASEMKTKQPAVFCPFFFFCLCPFLFSSVPSSSDDQPPAVIAEVAVLVEGEPESEEFARLIPIQGGEQFSLKKVDSSLKQIFKTGIFSDIRVLKEGGQKIKLIFLLTKKLRVRRIAFRGNERIPAEKLLQGLYALREGDSFSEEKLSRAGEEVKEMLNQQGYFFSKIQTSTETDAKNSRLDIVFEIQAARRFVIKEINLEGGLLLAEEEIKRKMESRPGEGFIPSLLEKDIERIKDSYHSLGYQQAEVEIKERRFDEKEGTVSLVLEIIPHQKIEIVVEGAEIPLDLLKPIWEARIFEEWGLDEGEAKIIRYLRKKNHIFASVLSNLEREEGKLRVVHRVSPGEKYRIEEISFEGLNFFSPSRLREELLLGQNLPFFSQIDGARLFELPREIEFFYQTQGFPEAKLELVFEKHKKSVKPVYLITEGRQQKIEGISVEGARLFDGSELLAEITSRKGGGYFHPNIQRDIEKLEVFYLNNGVRGTEILAEIESLGEDLFSVRFNLREGERVRVESIIIAGNQVTRQATILRELQLKEGGPARYDALRETKRRLERLGIFTEVRIEEIPLAAGRENLLIHVREGERNYAGLGLGLETKNEPRTFAVWNNVIRPRGTAELIRSNIFGWAAQLSLVGQISLKERRAVLSWEQPYFFGFLLQTFLNAWWEKEERNSYTFERKGFSLSTIQSLSSTRDMVFLTTLRVARTTLLELFISESEVDRQFFPFSTTSLSGSLIWDRRDDPFNPGRGYFFSSVLEWAYPLFQAESNYLKTFSKYQHFLSLLPGLSFGSTVRLGLGRGRMPIHERFFAGGSHSFRGVEFDALGPTDAESRRPVGGKALLLFNFELSFPLHPEFKNLLGAFFYDMGNVFSKRRQVSLASFENALGAGLRYRTPLGPVRLELGWHLNAPEGEKKALIFFTIGNVF